MRTTSSDSAAIFAADVADNAAAVVLSADGRLVLRAQLAQQRAQLLLRNAKLRRQLTGITQMTSSAPVLSPVGVQACDNPWLAAQAQALPPCRNMRLSHRHAVSQKEKVVLLRSGPESVLASIAEADGESGDECDEYAMASSDGSSTQAANTDGSDTEGDRDDSRTTVMIRNVPKSYSTCMLLEVLAEQGFAFGPSCNFVYVPVDIATGLGFGYAIVNFVTIAYATEFMSSFDGFCGWNGQLEILCKASVTWSPTRQGLKMLDRRYRNSPVMADNVPSEFKPVMHSMQF